MTLRLSLLAAEVRSDVSAWREQIELLRTHPLSSESATPEDCAFVALALHDAYSAVESAFTRIARDIDGAEPTGAAWHRSLLEQMALDLPKVRSPVADAPQCDALGELLAFRHFLRIAYGARLKQERLEGLRGLAITTCGQVADGLEAFCEWIDELASSAS